MRKMGNMSWTCDKCKRSIRIGETFELINCEFVCADCKGKENK